MSPKVATLAKRQLTPQAKQSFARAAYVAWLDRCWRDTWRAIGVEMMRRDAREAARMLLEADKEPDMSKREVRELWWRFVDGALVDHKLRHPSSRGERPWLYHQSSKSQHAGRRDVLCRFCRMVLIRDARLGQSHDIETAQHTVLCAVTTLATGGSASPGGAKGKP